MTQVLPPLVLPTFGNGQPANEGPAGQDGATGPQGPAGPENPLTLTGDVTGTTDNNQVSDLQGHTLDLSNTSDGNVLTYSALGGGLSLQPLSGSTLAGDVTGNTSSSTVSKLQGLTLSIPGSQVDGQVLTWDNNAGQITLEFTSPFTSPNPLPRPGGPHPVVPGTLVFDTDDNNPYWWTTGNTWTSVPLNGDIGGQANDNQIGHLQGQRLSLSDFTDGNVITWNAGANEYVLQPVSVTLGGDVVNASTSNFVNSLQGKALNLIVPSPTDGAVITWSANNSNLTLQQPFHPEFIYANVTSPIANPTSGTNVPLAFVTGNINSFITGNQTTFDLHFPPNSFPTVSFKLTANLGSLYDGSFTYQWWDLTNNVGLGNVAGNIGSGPSLDAVAIVPFNYAGNIIIQVALQLTFVNGTTFIGENTGGGFIGPWAIIETLGIPQIAGT